MIIIMFVYFLLKKIIIRKIIDYLFNNYFKILSKYRHPIILKVLSLNHLKR